MPEQPPPFVVVDKRKFTMDGDVREEARPSATEPAAAAEPGNVVTMPTRAADDLAEESMAPVQQPTFEETDAPGFDADGDGPETESDIDEREFLAPPSEEESAAQESAYRKSSTDLDAMLQEANPGMKAPGEVSFQHLVQSFYLSAIMAMGAGTQPGQKPRIDILGARQAIDLLGVLEEKTRGNLTPEEQQLLQGITFELRMSFLELTNAISRQAHQGPAAPPGGAR